MKYLVLLGDGMADYGREELGGLTPLQYAKKPNMDRLATLGSVGLVKTVPEGMTPGSDVANLSVLGYDPMQCYTGRAPLEAVSMGVKLDDSDVAFRCNLVTLSGEREYAQKTMRDYSAGEIKSEKSALLIRDLDSFFKKEDMRFYPGVSYRHLMVWKGGPADTALTPPHDISGRVIGGHLPAGSGGEVLTVVMQESNNFLEAHPLNNSGELERPANSVWFWGQGKTPRLENFRKKNGISGAVISAVDLIKGIGLAAGMKSVDVEGATGNIHTNFDGKTAAALEAFRAGADLVYVHVEAPDEAGHQGSTEIKVRAIEEIDRRVLGPLMDQMREFGDHRIMVLPDHPTPLSVMTHTSEPVPYVIFDSRRPLERPGAVYTEESGKSGPFVARGHDLMGMFING